MKLTDAPPSTQSTRTAASASRCLGGSVDVQSFNGDGGSMAAAYAAGPECGMGDRGFEPRTSALSERRSNRLS